MRGTKCSNCPHTIGPGGAKGLCNRCYQYALRNNGQLPPPELLVRPDDPKEVVRVYLRRNQLAELDALAGGRQNRTAYTEGVMLRHLKAAKKRNTPA